MIEVLIAMTNVVSQHAANQALLASLAEPLTQALAAWLSTFPSTLEATHNPEASLTHVPFPASTSAQSDPAAMKTSKTEEKSISTGVNDSSKKAKKLAPSALTVRLKGPKQPSLLTAKLKDSKPIKADTLDQSPSANPTRPSQGSISAQRGEPSKGGKGHDDGVVQLARRFIYHVLLHMPVEVLSSRQEFWMKHAVGLPELMQSCLGVAILQVPGVSYGPVV